VADLEKTIIEIRETLEKAYPIILKLAGFLEDKDTGKAAPGFEELRNKIEPIIKTDEEQLGDYQKAHEKFIKEASFTTFNRLVGLKALETRGLLEYSVISKSAATGGLSEAHYLYASRNPEITSKPGQGINDVLEEEFKKLSEELPQLYNGGRYGFLPRGGDTMKAIDLINSIPEEEWEKDDIIGWVYQYYQSAEKKIAYSEIANRKKISTRDKLIAVTQFYTEDYIVKYLVDNTLGRYWIEMHPESSLKENLKYLDRHSEFIEREKKSVREIKLIDPACGSGHFLLYAFELFYDMYLEEGYEENIPEMIVANNLYGLDIDTRAIQLTALSLYLKAKSINRNSKLRKSNLYSLDVGRFDEKKLMEATGFVDLSNKLYKNVFSTITSLKNLDMIGSLFRVKPFKRHKKKKDAIGELFSTSYEAFSSVIKRLKTSIEANLPSQRDAISSLLGNEYKQEINAISLLLEKYDVVVTNPPYRDSGTLSDYMKNFLREYYPDSKNDMYSAFIEKCLDLTDEEGLLGMVTMQSFMFISSHEKLREKILNDSRIVSMVHLGPWAFKSIGGEVVNTTMFTIRKTKTNLVSSFHSVKDLLYDEKIPAIEFCLLKGTKRSYKINQTEFTKIPGLPFVYWISDKIRDLFQKYEPLKKYAKVVAGSQTSDNDRFLRFWWEVNAEDISKDYKTDRKKWVPYAKGGPYNKWYGNLWWVVNWENDGEEIKKYVIECYPYLNGKYEYVVKNESYYFKEGLTIQRVTSGIPSVRLFSSNHIFDSAVNAIFIESLSPLALMALIMSRTYAYLILNKNPTTNKQQGDATNIPIPDISQKSTDLFIEISRKCIEIKKDLYSFHIIERDFRHDPLSWGIEQVRESSSPNKLVTNALKAFFVHKAELEAELLINEALNDEEVFKLYELLPEDKTLQDVLKEYEAQDSVDEFQSRLFDPVVEVLRSEGFPVGAYPERKLSDAERAELREIYLTHRHDRGSGKSEAINGMDLGIVEEIAGRLKVSPKTVVEELKAMDELPPEAVKDVLSEHMQALVLEIMKEDDDGIVPLHSNTRERNLFLRLQDKWRELGIGDHYDQIEHYLGMDIDKYLKKQFFKEHTKRFKNRPIVWHLVSEKENIFFFVLHHKWSQDRLLLLKSRYLSEIENTLNNMLASETDERKRQKFIAQLDELGGFGKKLSELLDEGYDPGVDDGVAKNIAPLQHKGLLKTNVLSEKLKNKMLNVEW